MRDPPYVHHMKTHKHIPVHMHVHIQYMGDTALLIM